MSDAPKPGISLNVVVEVLEELEVIGTEVETDYAALSSGQLVTLPTLVPTIAGTKYNIIVTAQMAGGVAAATPVAAFTWQELVEALEEALTIGTEFIADEGLLSAGQVVAFPTIVPTLGGHKYDINISIQEASAASK